MNVCFRTCSIRKIKTAFKSLLETGMAVFALMVVKPFLKQCLTDIFLCPEVIVNLVASPIHVVQIKICCRVFHRITQRKKCITAVVINAVIQCVILPFQKWMIYECLWRYTFVIRVTLYDCSLYIFTHFLMTCVTKCLRRCNNAHIWRKQIWSELCAHYFVNVVLKLNSCLFMFTFIILKNILS